MLVGLKLVLVRKSELVALGEVVNFEVLDRSI